MAAHPSIRARLWQPAEAIVYLGIALGIAMLCVLAATLFAERRAIGGQAEQQQQNIALAIEAEILREVRAIDLGIQAAVLGLSTPGLATMEPSLQQRLLFSSVTAGASSGVVITDASGQVIYQSAGLNLLASNLSDRPQFQAHRVHADQGLVMSPPLRGRSDGQWILSFSRRINAADGGFAGVAMSRLELSFFRHLFDRFNVGGGIINVVSTDGHLVARLPEREADIGRDMSSSAMFDHLRQASAGAFEAVASIDGVRRLYSYRKVEGLPLVIGVGFATSEIYQKWLTKALILAGAVGLLSLLGLAAVVAFHFELKRRAEAERATQRSERRHAEALARLDALFNHSPDILALFRVTGGGEFCYEAVNPVWEALFRTTKDRVLGRTPQQCIPPEAAARVTAALRDCVRSRRTAHFAFQSGHPQQTQEWEVQLLPVSDAEGAISRVIGIGRDLTERNQMEASLRQSQRMEAVGQLTAGVAHDFNNLLQAILAAVEMLQLEPGLSTAALRCITLAENAAVRGATLVHRLLAFARKQPLLPQLLRPDTVLASVRPLLDSLLGSEIGLEMDIGNDAWAVTADAAQLEGCLVNLAINARDAMAHGGIIRLRVCNEGAAAARLAGLSAVDHVRFAVEDQGTGMDAQTLARALEPFFTTKAIGQGTGLGLSMVHGFARQSGGDVRIESTVGVGTIVSLWLPRAGCADPQSKHLARNQVSKQIMVVDDEEAMREALSMFLRNGEFGVTEVASGDAALRLFRAGEPCDLLITDQSMPGLKGTDLIREVALLRPDLPVMLVTGFDLVSGVAELDGRIPVLRKPFRREAFLAQVAALLARPPTTDSAPAPAPSIAG